MKRRSMRRKARGGGGPCTLVRFHGRMAARVSNGSRAGVQRLLYQHGTVESSRIEARARTLNLRTYSARLRATLRRAAALHCGGHGTRSLNLCRPSCRTADGRRPFRFAERPEPLKGRLNLSYRNPLKNSRSLYMTSNRCIHLRTVPVYAFQKLRSQKWGNSVSHGPS